MRPFFFGCLFSAFLGGGVAALLMQVGEPRLTADEQVLEQVAEPEYTFLAQLLEMPQDLEQLHVTLAQLGKSLAQHRLESEQARHDLNEAQARKTREDALVEQQSAQIQQVWQKILNYELSVTDAN